MNNFLFYSFFSVVIGGGVLFSSPLVEFVTHLETQPHFKQASFSVYVVSEKDGRVILNHQGEKSFIPNSILKVITTAAALKVLGKDFQFKTQLVTNGSIKEGVLDGDLVIKGSGDPTLGSTHQGYNLTDKEQLLSWVAAVKNKGIREIKGSVVGDASCFEKALSPPTWLWEDLGNYYGAGACGLNFHENFYTLFFKLGQVVGDSVTLDKIEPYVSNLKIVNEVISGPKGSGDKAYVFGGEFSKTHYVRGTLPLDNGSFKIRGSIPDPAAFCAENLKIALEKEGVIVKGMAISSFDKKEISHTIALSEVKSPSLSKIVFLSNKLSLNLHSEALIKKMGEVKKNKGTHVAGLEVVQEYLKELGVCLDGFNIVDGSGLSNKNLVTAKGVVEFLCKLSKESYFPVFFQSLPCNKADDLGRLVTRFSSKKLSGRVFAKTGFSSQGESFAGFFINNEGDRCCFCIICNHFLGPRAIFLEQIQTLLEMLLSNQVRS